MATEDKSEFEFLEKTLDIDKEDMSNAIGTGTRNIYGSYRRKSKYCFFKVIIYGVYLIKSGLDIDEIVKTVELAKYIKNKKDENVQA